MLGLVSLTWPVIIAGSQLYGADRSRVLSIFELFRCETRAFLSIIPLNLICGLVPAVRTPILHRTQCESARSTPPHQLKELTGIDFSTGCYEIETSEFIVRQVRPLHVLQR